MSQKKQSYATVFKQFFKGEVVVRIHKDSNGVIVNAINDTLEADSQSGHKYDISMPDGSSVSVDFQSGPVKEAGVNGITSEALLAILIHRTNQLNARFRCRENSIAITKMEEALLWFDKRTADRQLRNVEGLNKE